MRRARGFTLLELMVAASIMLVAVAAATAVLLAAAQLRQRGESQGDEAGWSKIAMTELVANLQNSGALTPGGFYMAVGGTTPTTYPLSPVFGVDGTTGMGTTNTNMACTDPAASGTTASPVVSPPTDDLWLEVPSRNLSREGCNTAYPDAAVTIMTGVSSGTLTVGCTNLPSSSPAFTVGETLMATNMTTGALITASSIGTTLGYSESGTGLSDAPSSGGFQKQDTVFGTVLYHYYIRNDANGIPGLYRSQGAVTGAEPSGTYPNGPYPVSGRPLIDTDGATMPHLVQAHIDDLQVAYGFDTQGNNNPATYTWQNGLSPHACPGVTPNFTQLRAVRISLEAMSSTLQLTSSNAQVLTSTNQHRIIENNYQASTQPAADGYQRLVYMRTIALPNLAPGNL
jgi:prepilin-type N-terminal cleavage/methylation domain-containing protein